MHLFSAFLARFAGGPPQQELIGLPKCAYACFKLAAPKANSWGCHGSAFTCLCENFWFASGYQSCVGQSCSANDALDANSHLDDNCDKLFKRGFSSSSGSDPSNTFQSITTSSVLTPFSTAAIATSTTDPIPSPATSLDVATTTIISTPAPSSSIVVTTSSTSATTVPSPTASAGSLDQSAKIGIGLGVPLAAIILALLGYIVYRYNRRKQRSRGSYMGSSEVAGPHSAGAEKQGPGDPMLPAIEGQELHGQHVTPYSRELEGSPGWERRELP